MDQKPFHIEEYECKGLLGNDYLSKWITVLCMVSNDMLTAQKYTDIALENNHMDNEAVYFLMLQWAHLREGLKLLVLSDELPAINEFMTKLPNDIAQMKARLIGEAQQFKVPGSPSSHLKNIRDSFFHYPEVGSNELDLAVKEILNDSASKETILWAGPDVDTEPLLSVRYAFADLVRVNICFKDIEFKDKDITDKSSVVFKIITLIVEFLGLVDRVVSYYCDQKGIVKKRLR